ncbi:MAG TPA: hypothetical protein VK689_21250 [Armatimonadota bacterium]|nr:hypothetical protein [Armatimonadota bacterium]
MRTAIGEVPLSRQMLIGNVLLGLLLMPVLFFAEAGILVCVSALCRRVRAALDLCCLVGFLYPVLSLLLSSLALWALSPANQDRAHCGGRQRNEAMREYSHLGQRGRFERRFVPAGGCSTQST